MIVTGGNGPQLLDSVEILTENGWDKGNTISKTFFITLPIKK
jgi:hypothetical protein